MIVRRYANGLMLAATAALLVAAVGCNSGPAIEEGVTVTGKILKGGKPLSPPGGEEAPPGMEEMEAFEIVLVPAGSDGQVRGQIAGDYDDTTGDVKFIGAGKGVKPGKYTLVINSADAMPGMGGGDDDDGAGGDPRDPFSGAFALGKSPIEVDVPNEVGGTHDLGTIELDTVGKGG